MRGGARAPATGLDLYGLTSPFITLASGAKAILATEATSLCHGPEAARKAAETARQTFGGSVVTGAPGMEGNLSESLPTGLPTIEGPQVRLDEGILLYDLLREAGLVKSNSEARRFIRGGVARVNDAPVREETGTVGPVDLTPEGAIKPSAGRKRHVHVRPA